ncbi:hypothetical protein NSB20_08825 [Bacteroides acidifaciens]|uniref:hypothetical protein n=1 Tax=Bacteroides acidifaciens TaxID=85831 RepID=UPI00214A500A|nr:hypothetical protein [Bacteroides acidifaciens]MCR2005632.1 hypothetical protein [Bacteroides acidifaciens]
MSDIKEKTLRLIDGLKATCQSYGMGNDGNEYKIITQVFLYKFRCSILDQLTTNSLRFKW